MRPSPLRRTILATAATALLAFATVGPTAAAQEASEEPSDAVYTMLGRGYAVIFGYPADEIPGSDDGGGEEEGGEEEPAEPRPDQTCPEGQRGVPEELQARIEQLSDTSDHDAIESTENEVPTPRGQPIKFDLGLADTSLRSDPGSHAIASFLYVDLGGGIDPETTAEADGYASGHARHQERCSQPFSSSEGDAQDVHVIAEAVEGPYAYAFNQTQRPTLQGGVALKESITVAEMDGRSDPVWGKVTTITQGVTVGEIHADEVVTVIEVTTDGTDEGTAIKAFTDVVGLSVAGTPLEVTSGAPPVSAGAHVVGVAAPEVRTRPDGTIEVTAGGMYVAGRVDNPLGLQRSQAAFIGGAWYDFSIASFPSFEDDFDDEFEAAPPPPPTQAAPPASDPAFTAPSQPVTEPPAFEPAPQPEVQAQPTREEGPEVAPEMVTASSRYGVYRTGPQSIGPSLVLAAFLMSLMTGVFVWARHTYPEIRAALTVPMFRWMDHAYRAFMRG